MAFNLREVSNVEVEEGRGEDGALRDSLMVLFQFRLDPIIGDRLLPIFEVGREPSYNVRVERRC